MNRRILAKLIMFFLFSVAIFNPRSSLAQGAGITAANQLFYQANSAYKDGKYEAAIDDYEKAVSLGLESGNIYYNLGNSYFKRGKIGKAILSYERAKRFIPDDSDLKSNYDYVKSLLNLGPQLFGNWLERSADRLFDRVTINFLTILLSVIYIILIVALLSNLFLSGLKKLTKPIIFILVSIFILAAVSLRSKIIYFSTGAIVISKQADVKFEPLESATTYFKLTEGSIVEMLERAENWYKIKRPDGKMGWVDKAELGLIFN